PAHNKNLKSLLVTSAVPKDGKSAIVANLAVSISQTGRSVLIIDANLRAPAIHKYFAVSNETGLTNVLSNEIDFSSAVQATSYPKIWVITSGVAIQNPVEVLDSERMAEIISQAAKQYDVVLVDSPASISVTDPTVLTPMVDGVLLVVRHNWVRREALQATIRHLTAVNGNIIGIVSNRTDLGARTRLLRLR
ncbi:MAG: CpsD/CapB family tyrosine-protein kinase, partial [Anaerolineales bacterium]